MFSPKNECEKHYILLEIVDFTMLKRNLATLLYIIIFLKYLLFLKNPCN